MNPSNSYQTVAQRYADGVTVLFARSGEPTGERGGRGPASPEEMAAQAEELSPVSAQLTQELAAQLTETEDLAVRTQASVRLLALALTDLEISASLLEAARDEEEGISWEKSERTERSVAIHRQIPKNLQILLGHEEVDIYEVNRSEDINDIPTARIELSNTIEDTLYLILKRASNTCESAVSGIMGLGLNELPNAAGMIGMGIAEILGQAENVNRLKNAFRQFLQRAWESLVELLGQQLAQAGAEQMLEWVKEHNQGSNLSEILERLYQTQKTGAEMKQLVRDSQAELEQLTAAISGVLVLDSAYLQQIDWAEKSLNGLKKTGMLLAAALPQGELILVLFYIVLGTYVVLVGADYVDAPPPNRLDIVPGVRRIVEAQLASE